MDKKVHGDQRIHGKESWKWKWINGSNMLQVHLQGWRQQPNTELDGEAWSLASAIL